MQPYYAIGISHSDLDQRLPHPPPTPRQEHSVRLVVALVVASAGVLARSAGASGGGFARVAGRGGGGGEKTTETQVMTISMRDPSRQGPSPGRFCQRARNIEEIPRKN